MFCSTSFSTAWMWIQSIAKVFPCIPLFNVFRFFTSTNPGTTGKGENRQQLTFHKKKQTIGEQAQSHLCWQSFSQVLQLNRYQHRSGAMLLVSQQYRINNPIQSHPIRHLDLSVLNLSIDLNFLNCPVSPVLRCYLHLRWHYF